MHSTLAICTLFALDCLWLWLQMPTDMWFLHRSRKESVKEVLSFVHGKHCRGYSNYARFWPAFNRHHATIYIQIRRISRCYWCSCRDKRRWFIVHDCSMLFVYSRPIAAELWSQDQSNWQIRNSQTLIWLYDIEPDRYMWVLLPTKKKHDALLTVLLHVGQQHSITIWKKNRLNHHSYDNKLIFFSVPGAKTVFKMPFLINICQTELYTHFQQHLHIALPPCTIPHRGQNYVSIACVQNKREKHKMFPPFQYFN